MSSMFSLLLARLSMYFLTLLKYNFSFYSEHIDTKLKTPDCHKTVPRYYYGYNCIKAF